MPLAAGLPPNELIQLSILLRSELARNWTRRSYLGRCPATQKTGEWWSCELLLDQLPQNVRKLSLRRRQQRRWTGWQRQRRSGRTARVSATIIIIIIIFLSLSVPNDHRQTPGRRRTGLADRALRGRRPPTTHVLLLLRTTSLVA